MTSHKALTLTFLPLCSFFMGYYMASCFTQQTTIKTPHLVGLTTFHAIMMCSNLNLHPAIIATKHHQEFPEGTILEQIPHPGTGIKASQSINLVVSTQPERPCIPHVCGMQKEEACDLLAKQGFKIICYVIPHISVPNSCFAYHHRYGECTSDNTAILYISSGEHSAHIWPQLCGHPLSDVQDFLATRAIVPHVISDQSYFSNNDIVTDQRPLAGSIIRGKEKPYVQLKVSKRPSP